MDQVTIDLIGELWLPFGCLGAVGALLLNTVSVDRPAATWPVAVGLVVGVAAGTGAVPARLVLGLIVAVAVEAIGPRFDGELARGARTALALGAALVVVGGAGPGAPVLVAAGVVAVPALVDHGRHGRRLAPGLVALSVLGIWLAVGRTDEATALIGASTAIALIGLAGTLTIDRWGAVACTAALVITIGLGAAGDEPSLLGGTVAVSALALAPAVRRFFLRAPTAVVVIVVQAVVAVGGARAAGLANTAVAAAAIGAAAGTGGLLVLTVISRAIPRAGAGTLSG